MKRKQKKKKFDYSIIIHIIAILVFVGVFFAFYVIAGQKNAGNLLKNAENMIKEKAETPQNITPEKNIVKEQKKPTEPFEKYAFTYTYAIKMTGPLDEMTIKIPIPKDENEKQYISSLEILPKPTKMYHDGPNNIAEYKYEKLNIDRMNITMSGIANIRTYDYYTASVIDKNSETNDDLARYLQKENLIESDDPSIIKIAEKLKGETQRDTVNNVFRYTQKTLSYNAATPNLGAKEAIRQRRGKCAEYAAVMTALLRANGIPARVVNGNIARETNQRHGWVEVYYDKYGWVAYDPTAVGTIVKVYDQNGTLVKQETKVDPEKSMAKYIASLRNSFSPLVLSYTPGKGGRSSVSLDMKIDIHKVADK